MGAGRAGQQDFAGAFPERAMERATASSRIDGNRIHLQFEGPVAFDAWLEAIAGASRFIHFENYILRDDPIGRRFRDALIERARSGVRVRVLYDWMGCWATPRRYWKPFREAGIEVRAFNPPSIADPLGLLQRDHRKLVVVDGEVCFVGGFCVGQAWAGTRTDPPWRDTGVEIRGPAVAAAARTFERIWAERGPAVAEGECCDPARVEAAGDAAVWLIEGLPWRSRVYRATQLMASVASRRLWITDPYFVAPRPVSEALMAAARDGVDVRILVPAHNNWPWVGSLSRGGYRSLLRAGVRIFEWEGSMIHAKTSVVDGRWCRIGSSNLNAASLLGNWELDIGVLDHTLATQVEGLFLADLASSVEIVLPGRAVKVSDATPASSSGKQIEVSARELADRVSEGSLGPGSEPGPLKGAPGLGTAPLDPEGLFPERVRSRLHAGGQTLTLADLVRAGSALGDAIAGHRVVGREDRVLLTTVAVLLLLVAVISGFFPRLVGWLFAFLTGWVGLVLAIRGGIQAWRARHEPGDPTEGA
ncbi:MAG: phospholipase D-like domain-containing protein [Gemmatimonadota bacterium]